MRIPLFILIIISPGYNQTNIRYNSFISAQCKARCLYEYRNSSIRSFTSRWRSIWERCPRLFPCNSCLLPCDFDPTVLFSSKQSCRSICSTLKIFECEQSCLFIQNLYQENNRSSLSNDFIIPQPSNLIAIERPSRRTVRLKWTIDQSLASEPIFYVIEAQWMKGKSDDYQSISKWGFVREEVSTEKSILRNIQRDSRWYLFRVTAVTRYGYSNTSQTNQPFRLTIHIDPPKNFTMKDYRLNSSMMNVTLQWERSNSSVNDYQICWEVINDSLNQSQIIETSQLELTIPFLSIDHIYLFQIRSMIYTDFSSPLKLFFNLEDQLTSLENVQISSPYFFNGLIKANLSWAFLPIFPYEITWIETVCYSSIFSCCYSRQALTIENHFQLYDLRFHCTYLVTIQWKKRVLYEQFFNVTSCELIEFYGRISPPCLTDRKTMDFFSSLPTIDFIVRRNETGWRFSWTNLHSTIPDLFYRLHIEQIELLSINHNEYFLPYSKWNHRGNFNVTLSLVNGDLIRQEQTILIVNHCGKRRCSLGYFLFIVLSVHRIGFY